ncbi:hypothetical protein RRF57_001739 [Xylaria bambusicola]|uniref:Uncharacterized protein n=1 Tax=Xylaria bambusicola TaxID=326684 RepID=A0AAN7UCF8_9PEZI
MSRTRSAGPVSTTTGSQNTMPSHQTSQPLEPVLQKPIVKIALKLLRQLRPNIAQLHIDSQNWTQLHITCSKLDLSWKSENGGDFLRLKTPQQMQQIASQYGFDHVSDPSRDPDHPFHDSRHMADHLNRHLFAISHDAYLVDCSRWICQHPDGLMARKLGYYPADCQWKVDYILDVKDASLPHTNCTLIEAGKLEENKLMFSEVWSILMLTLNCLRNPQKERYEVVPVTVVTISGPTFRIVQGYIDGKTGSVNIRKSGIVPIGSDKKTMKEQMMLLVRWLIAEPVWPSRH